jgi:hypothetical protein
MILHMKDMSSKDYLRDGPSDRECFLLVVSVSLLCWAGVYLLFAMG